MADLREEHFLITRVQKEQMNGHRSFVLWFSGLPASGKSTVACQVEEKLFRRQIRTMILDGDNTRMGINKDLDFSAMGRRENVRRVAEIAKLMNEAGVVAIVSFISPFREDRAMAREIIGEESYIEVFIDSELGTCKARDPKGLYRLAEEGKIRDFTGVGSPYEPPLHPDIHLRTDRDLPDVCTKQVISFLEKERWIIGGRAGNKESHH